MKKYVLVIVIALSATSGGAQTLLGTNSKDSVLLKSSTFDRIKARHTGQVIFHDWPVSHNQWLGTTQTASVSIGPRARDTSGVISPNTDGAILLVSDNFNDGHLNAATAIYNNNRLNGLGVGNDRNHTDIDVFDNAGIVSYGGTLGIYRFNNVTGTSDWVGYNCKSEVSGNTTSDIINYRSGGQVNTSAAFNTWKDFSAVNLAHINETTGTRYGLHLGFDKGILNNAWGVYQTSSSVKNHFNGASLFGTTTDNTFDKVQVTGGMRTDGLGAGWVTKTTGSPYTAINTDYSIFVNAGGYTVTLPDANIDDGKIFIIKKISSNGAGNVTVNTTSGNIDGAGSYVMSTQYSMVAVQWDGTNYHIIAEIVRP